MMLRCGVPLRYLLCSFIVGNICLNTEWPFYVNIILVQLQQKHNQHKQCVHHEKGKHRRITQLLQIRRNPILSLDDIWFVWSMKIAFYC